jgi:hypothetical protein
MIVVFALYGLKSSRAAFQSMLSDCMYEIWYKPSLGDPDVGLRPAIATERTAAYEYVIVYADDIFCVPLDTVLTMSQIKESIKFKNIEIKPPSTYLGATLKLKSIEGTTCWNMSSSKYVHAAITNVQEKLAAPKTALLTKCYTPLRLVTIQRM